MTIGYGEADGYERTPETILTAAHKQDARLVAEAAIIGIAGPPVHVRNPEGAGAKITDGQFMNSVLPIAGFAIIEAANLEEAIKKVSGVPCSVAHRVVEIWPIGLKQP